MINNNNNSSNNFQVNNSNQGSGYLGGEIYSQHNGSGNWPQGNVGPNYGQHQTAQFNQDYPKIQMVHGVSDGWIPPKGFSPMGASGMQYHNEFQPNRGGLISANQAPHSSFDRKTPKQQPPMKKNSQNSLFGAGIWGQPKDDNGGVTGGSSIGYFLPDFIEDEIDERQGGSTNGTGNLSINTGIGNASNQRQVHAAPGTNGNIIADDTIGDKIQLIGSIGSSGLNLSSMQSPGYGSGSLNQTSLLGFQPPPGLGSSGNLSLDKPSQNYYSHHPLQPLPIQQHQYQQFNHLVQGPLASNNNALSYGPPPQLRTAAQMQSQYMSSLNPYSSPHGTGTKSQTFTQSTFAPQQIPPTQVQQMMKICIKCQLPIQPTDQFITSHQHTAQNGGTTILNQVFTHLTCMNNNSSTTNSTAPSSMQSMAYQIQNPLNSIIPSSASMIQLTPEMLIFDFQIMHPLTLTTIFQLQNQTSSQFFQDRTNMPSLAQTITLNKLLCASTTIPFNVAIVHFKWDFFREPQSLIEGLNPMDPLYQVQLQNLPQRPNLGATSIYQNQIQGQINFMELINFNDKNLTITLKAQRGPQPDFMLNRVDPVLTLNFNYNQMDFGHGDGSGQGQAFHVLKNLYMSFTITQQDFEHLKLEAQKLIHLNPSLTQLLKAPTLQSQDQMRFITVPQASTTSLHQLFKGEKCSPGPINSNADDHLGSAIKQSNLEVGNYQRSLLLSDMSELSIDEKPEMKPVTGFLDIKNFPKKKKDGTSKNESSSYQIQSDIDSGYMEGHEVMNAQSLLEETKGHDDKNSQADGEVNKPSTNGPGYMMRKTKIGIEISSLEESQAAAQQSMNRTKTSGLTMKGIDGEEQSPTKKSDKEDSQSKTSQSSGGRSQTSSKTLTNKIKSCQIAESSQPLTGPAQVGANFLEPKQTYNKKKRIETQNSTQSIRSTNSDQSKASSSSSGSRQKRMDQEATSQSENADDQNSQIQNEMRGRVVELAKSQHGSKQLQKVLARASPDFVNFAIEECLHDMHDLMVDQYGNYFCQKLLQSSSSAQRHKILNVLRPHILKISCDKKGTHSMQCLIEMINMPEEEQELREGIKKHVVDLAFDANGTHVLQKVLLCLGMKEENVNFIFDPVLEHFVELSMDQNGLCVIKKIVSKVENHSKRIQIGQVLSDNVVQLVQNPYGNYAVQQALDNWPLEYCLPIFQKLEPHLMQLSVQKFSSNVIERVLEKSEFDTVERFMKRLCDIEVMKGLIKNTYGFYVMQKLVHVLRKHKASIKPVQQAIQDTIQYATDKQLRQKWQNILTQNQTGSGSSGNAGGQMQMTQASGSSGNQHGSSSAHHGGGPGYHYTHTSQGSHGGNYQGANSYSGEKYHGHYYGSGSGNGNIGRENQHW